MGNVAGDFVSLIGPENWTRRTGAIRAQFASGIYTSRVAAQRYAAESAIEKARRGQGLVPAEASYMRLVARLLAVHGSLRAAGRKRLAARLAACLEGTETLMKLLHLAHVATLQEARGFAVSFAGLETDQKYDLLIERGGVEAEIVCETISAEDGHAVPRSLWARLIDRIDPDLQTWLAAHPGRYLLKMTLPQGLRQLAESLPALHGRINAMLAAAARADHDPAAILRLDPLLLAGAQAGDKPQGMMASLRREFGPEAQFSLTEAGQSLLVMAARGGAENEVAAAVRRRLAAIAPARLSGTRPGILAMFLDDTDPAEWRRLRDSMVLEGEARQFLTFPEAKPVIAVTCATRYELAGDGAEGGDVRYRNPMHPDAKSAALAPAVLSTV